MAKKHGDKKNTKLITHVTRGNVLDELDLDEQELLELKLKADLPCKQLSKLHNHNPV
jgi:hypothetical protein